MGAKQDSRFVLELMDFVFQVTGKPLPCNLRRKLDDYSKQEVSNVTMNIKKAVMVFINYSLKSREPKVGIASKIYESQIKELVKKPPCDFLKFISDYAYASVSNYSNHKLYSPDKFFTSVVRLLVSERKKGQIDGDFWKKINEAAIVVLVTDDSRSSYRKLRLNSINPDMPSEKGFVLKIMNIIFDFCNQDLPIDLKMDFDNYRTESKNDPNIKDAIYVLLREYDRKAKLLDELEPIMCYYYHLTFIYFHEKYFLEFCIFCTKEAMIENNEESDALSPVKAYKLLVSLLRFAKDEGKFSSLERMNEAATQILNEDRDRIEHERQRRDALYIESNENTQQAGDSQNLVISSQHEVQYDCRCCQLN